MKTLLKIILGLFAFVAALVILFVAATQFFPSTYKVQRSTVIKAPAHVIFTKIGDLHEWSTWTPWHERDPNMVLHYSPVTTGIGAWHAWESKTEGNGKMTYTTWESDHSVGYDLEFPDFKMQSVGSLVLEPNGGETKITWTCEGKLTRNPMQRVFGLMMDKMVGPDFEKGFAKLKTQVEK